MKLTKWVEFSKEVEIELSAEDISHIFRDDGETIESKTRAALYNLNSIASFLIGIPNEVINEMTPGQRETISRFLREHAQKFES